MIVDFLDTRLPEERRYFKEAAEIALMINGYVFSHTCIIPGKTTIGQVRRSVYNRVVELGIRTSFNPISIRVTRNGVSEGASSNEENTMR